MPAGIYTRLISLTSCLKEEVSHGKSNLVFAVLLIALGLVGYLGTGSQHPTALIPTWFGLALGLFGFLAISPSEARRKLFMHINVTIGLLGFLGAARSRRCAAMCTPRRRALRRMQIALASQADDGRPAADLRDSVRALVHCGAALGEGLTHGDNARRRNGNGRCAPSARRTDAARARARRTCPSASPNLKKLWPQIRALVAPRKGLLVAGLCLMAVNRVAGLVLPYTSKPLAGQGAFADQHPHPELLPQIIALVFSAMMVQAITSFSLTQLLSKAGQRLIAEMRRQVQRHVGLLSVAYYDENRTGTLVARIMTDVEGVRNLVGTGLVEFVGGLLTAVLAFVYLLHRSVAVTLTVFSVVGAFVFVLQYAFKKIRPIFRERGKINAEVTGRLTESLGGVRVIKGYHAEEREAAVFSGGRGAAAGQRDEVADHDQRARLASTTVLGLVSALVMWLGGHRVLNHTWTVGDYFSYNMFLAFMIAPVFQIVNIGTQLTEAFAGLDRTSEIMSELEENQDARPHAEDAADPGQRCASKTWSLPTSRTSRCCTASALRRSRER